jgi:hypothetical protein
VRSIGEPVREPISDRNGNARFWLEATFAMAAALGFGTWGLFDRDEVNDLGAAGMLAIGLIGATLAARHLRKRVRGIPVFAGAITVTERLGRPRNGFSWREKLGLANQVRYPDDPDTPTGTCHVRLDDAPEPLCGDRAAEMVPAPGVSFSSVPDRLRCNACERQLVRLARLSTPDGRLGTDAAS